MSQNKKQQKTENKEVRKGWLFMLSGIALIIKIILLAFGIEVPEDAIDNTINVILGLMSSYGIFRTNIFGDFGRKQYRLLKHSGLLHLLSDFTDKFKKEDK